MFISIIHTSFVFYQPQLYFSGTVSFLFLFVNLFLLFNVFSQFCSFFLLLSLVSSSVFPSLYFIFHSCFHFFSICNFSSSKHLSTYFQIFIPIIIIIFNRIYIQSLTKSNVFWSVTLGISFSFSLFSLSISLFFLRCSFFPFNAFSFIISIVYAIHTFVSEI